MESRGNQKIFKGNRMEFLYGFFLLISPTIPPRIFPGKPLFLLQNLSLRSQIVTLRCRKKKVEASHKQFSEEFQKEFRKECQENLWRNLELNH